MSSEKAPKSHIMERQAFVEFADSLKLVRKENLEDATTGDSVIDKLYTNLLPNNGVRNKLNLPMVEKAAQFEPSFT